VPGTGEACASATQPALASGYKCASYFILIPKR